MPGIPTRRSNYVGAFDMEEVYPFLAPLETGAGIKLPASVYSVVFLVPLAIDQSMELKGCLACFLFSTIILPHFLLCFIAIALQVLMVYWLEGIVSARNQSCPTDTMVQLSGLFLFNVKVITDIVDSFDMLRWIYNYPRSKKCMALKVMKKKGAPIAQGQFKGGMQRCTK